MSESPLNPDTRVLAADLFEQFSDTVCRALARAFPGTDPQQVCDAVVRAIFQVSGNFSRYDARRGSLKTFLFAAARRILRHRLRADDLRRQREQKKMGDAVTGTGSAHRSPLEALADRDLVEQALHALHLTAVERQVLDLWMLGETDVTAYAAVMGLQDQTQADCEQPVRRLLARLRQRIHRLGLRLRSEETDP
jgi:RNA polymerase sigma factor (sigma-70 family)